MFPSGPVVIAVARTAESSGKIVVVSVAAAALAAVAALKTAIMQPRSLARLESP
jgi:hypothetical protein